eukprot:CAMPEP_0113329064 /NCGR_PEP_ID=MMETSP0010_2-20120614/20594_1 /TAXON_ID=216773 ORGANISM="Corethron hystrix, Strain 308" /NCGR_SAMPLE_ID=MMETSP0010_2 /ASSEMBLY_ACC=CAM_ASM_000155 /LENGTH=211 /DNA_ID=CAMNT_0000190915 /DNA_START=74 /DNA_END=709 /DNA_ORIENTATION=+ /assembly_acc=CAM_ASM_000155
MGVIERTVAYFMIVVNRGIEMLHGIPVLISYNDLPFPFFRLFDKVQHNNGTAISFEEIRKVCSRGLIGRIHPVEHDGWFGHGDAAFLRPVGGNTAPHLQVAGEGSTGRRGGFVMNDLLMFDIVRYFSLVGHAPFEIASSCKVSGSPRQQNETEGSSIIVDLSLYVGAVHEGTDPISCRHPSRTFFKLAGQKMVPRIHVLRGRGRKGPQRSP